MGFLSALPLRPRGQVLQKHWLDEGETISPVCHCQSGNAARMVAVYTGPRSNIWDLALEIRVETMNLREYDTLVLVETFDLPVFR